MGLYDKLYIKKKLPFPLVPDQELRDIDWSDVQFQTKSFHCLLDNFEVHEDGLLYKEFAHVEEQYDNGIMRKVRVVDWKPFDFTGEVSLITIISEGMCDYTIRVTLKFISGALIDLFPTRLTIKHKQEPKKIDNNVNLDNKKLCIKKIWKLIHSFLCWIFNKF